MTAANGGLDDFRILDSSGEATTASAAGALPHDETNNRHGGFPDRRMRPAASTPILRCIPARLRATVGRLRAEGRIRDFRINAAATATWTSGDDIRRLGCAARECESLVLPMPDDGSE